MKAKDLIKWIQDHHAEELEVLIEHRDEGGTYRTAEHLGEYQAPMLCSYSDESFGTVHSIDCSSEKKTAILL